MENKKYNFEVQKINTTELDKAIEFVKLNKVELSKHYEVKDITKEIQDNETYLEFYKFFSREEKMLELNLKEA